MSWLKRELHKLHAWLNKPAVKKVLAEINAVLGSAVFKTIITELLAEHQDVIKDPAKALEIVQDVMTGLELIETDPALATADGIEILKAKLQSAATLDYLVEIEEKDGLDAATATEIAQGLIAKAIEKLNSVK